MKTKLTLALCVLLGIMFNGYAQWSWNNSMNTLVSTAQYNGGETNPKVVHDSNGGGYISWFSVASSAYQINLMLQRFAPDGTLLWQNGGITVSAHPSMTWTTDYGLKIDKDSNAILVLQDIRNNGYNNVYAYKISPEGNFIWGPDGIALTNDTLSCLAPQAAILSNGDAVFTWVALSSGDTVSPPQIGLQKVSSSGNVMWGGGQALVIQGESGTGYKFPFITSTPNDEVIIVWKKEFNLGTVGDLEHIYTQKFDSNGNQVWPSHVPVYADSGLIGTFSLPVIESDRNGGVFVAWASGIPQSTILECLVQHVDSSGNCSWTQDGIPVTQTQPSGSQVGPSLCFAPTTQNLYVFWKESDAYAGTTKINSQRIDGSGTLKWPATGNTIEENTLSYTVAKSRIFNSNEVVVVYGFNAWANPEPSVIKAVAVDSLGSPVWPISPLVISSPESTKDFLELSDYSNATKQVIAVWSDNRNHTAYTYDIFAQNIRFDGTIGTGLSKYPEYSDFSIDVFPNPASDHINIALKRDKKTKAKIELYDISGRCVANIFEGVLSNNHVISFRVNQFEAGIYLLKYQDELNVSSVKIIIDK